MGLSITVGDLPTQRVVLSQDGAESIIYDLPDWFEVKGQSGLVYKEYRKNIMRGQQNAAEFSISAVIEAYSTARRDYQAIIDSVAAWPLAVVTGAHGIEGLVMRRIDAKFFNPGSSSIETTPIRQLEQWIQPDRKIIRIGLKPFTDEGRAAFIRRTLNYFDLVHSLDLVIGDISFGNILAYVPRDNQVRCSPGFIEIDTYRKADCMPALEQRHSPEFWPPEFHSAKSTISFGSFEKARMRIQTKETDVYKAGLIALRLFDESEYPTQATDLENSSSYISRVFGDRTTECLSRALAESPQDRPTMHELAQSFLGRF